MNRPITKIFSRLTLAERRALELEQAEHALLDADHNLELWTAQREMCRGRIARLRGSLFNTPDGKTLTKVEPSPTILLRKNPV